MTNNKQQQVIAIIQDNKLILKTIDISSAALLQPLGGSSASTSSQTASSGPKIIQIQTLNNSMNQNLNNNNNSLNNQQLIINSSNNILQITSPSNNSNIIQLVPKNELTNNFNQMHKLAVVAAAAAAASSSSTPAASCNTTPSTSIVAPNLSLINEIASSTSSSSSYTLPELSQINHTNELILGAHKDTWLYLKEKSKKLKSQFNMKKNLSLEQLFHRGLLQMLKETKFLESFNSLIENTVLFAKIVPYFMEMHESDRIALLKSSVFEIICIRHSQLFDLVNNKFILPMYEANLSKDFLIQKLPECKTFIELLFDFMNEFSQLDLSDLEIAVFCSFLLFNTG